MPTYVYETIPAKAGDKPRRFEVEQRMSAAALTTDPETGLPVRRVISGGLGFISAAKDADVPPCATGACPMPDAPMKGGHGGGCPCCH